MKDPSIKHNSLKGAQGLKRILNATRYSYMGLKSAFVIEAAFRQLVWLNCILISLSFLLDVSRLEQVMLIAVCLLSLIVELLNSAIEATVDRISLELNPLSKVAKDMGSAAQSIALLLIALCWARLLWP